jgi:hypothetical protein
MQNEETMGTKRMGLEECSSCIPTHCFSLSLPLSLSPHVFVCCLALFLVQHVFLKTSKFQMENEDILWESKESGCRMLIMLSNTLFLFLFYLVLFLFQNVFPQNLQISKGKRRYCGNPQNGVGRKDVVDHAFLHIIVCLHLLSQTFSDYKKHGAKLQNSNGK